MTVRTSLARSAALLAAIALADPASAQLFRSIDGSGNNPGHPNWGRANTELLRMMSMDYGDGVATPAGEERPSVRLISNKTCAKQESVITALPITDFVWQWGQFLDHDIGLTGPADPVEPFDIPVPMGDPDFDPFLTGSQVIPMNRSLYMPHEPNNPRQQVNQVTAFLDASMIYGSDPIRARALRALDGTGKLRTSEGELLPYNEFGLPNDPSPSASYFLAGDVRANEQVGLTSMHTLFLREHNFWCDVLNTTLPFLNGDAIYHLARAFVGAEIQSITYNEFLPILLGPDALPPYEGWRPEVNPSIANEFSSAAYRFGHSMLSPNLMRLDEHGEAVPAGHLALKDAFFDPTKLLETGIDPVLRGLASQCPQEIDTFIVDDVRNFLFGPPGSGGFDLAALNMQRGRDHGLPCYNQARVDMGYEPVESFEEITSNEKIAAALAALYDTPDDVDLWVGGLAEDHVEGALLGELFHSILVDQFTRLRDGDRYWYQNNVVIRVLFPGSVERQTLSRIIRRNTDIGAELQRDAFWLAGEL